MAVLRERPYSNYNFLVDLGGGEVEGPHAGFSEVVLPEVAFDVIEYRSGNERESGVRKMPGRAHYGNVVLKRGAAGDLSLYRWVDDLRNGNVGALRNVSISLQNEDRTDSVLRWRLARAWPVRYKFAPLDGKGKDVLVELLELAFERLEIE